MVDTQFCQQKSLNSVIFLVRFVIVTKNIFKMLPFFVLLDSVFCLNFSERFSKIKQFLGFPPGLTAVFVRIGISAKAQNRPAAEAAGRRG